MTSSSGHVIALDQSGASLGTIRAPFTTDGIEITNAPPRQIEHIKKDLCTTFSEHGLKITIEANKTIANFLDVIPSPTTSHFTSTRNLTTQRRSSKTSQRPSTNSSPRFHMTKIHSTKQFHSIRKPLTTADSSTTLHFYCQPHENRQTPIERMATEIAFGTTPRSVKMSPLTSDGLS